MATLLFLAALVAAPVSARAGENLTREDLQRFADLSHKIWSHLCKPDQKLEMPIVVTPTGKTALSGRPEVTVTLRGFSTPEEICTLTSVQTSRVGE
ncbi:hypothetical protein CL652_00540 [bacterium]|nr:hypothetical protein [bacterium]